MNNPLTKLKNPRTNWKYILIVVILAFVMGGGIFWYQLQVTNELISLIEYPKIRKPEKVSFESSKENLTPRQVVQKFIEADMAGARLGGETAKRAPDINEYLSSDFIYEGELVVVIKKYEIIDDFIPEKDHPFVYGRVRFFCEKGLASNFEFECSDFFNSYNLSADPSIEYDPVTQIETVTFGLRQECGQWRIYSPNIYPHISEETFKKHFGKF